MHKNKVLIIDKHHFGTLTDSYKWCEYLCEEYNVTVLCFDTGLDKNHLDGVKIKYVSYNGNYVIRGIRFLLVALWNILFFEGKIMVVYFDKCEWLKRLFPLKKIILDIRTLSVSQDLKQRKKYDLKLRKASQYFDLITAISEGVKRKLNLPNKCIEILPLGSDVISEGRKDYSSLKLLYVGTFVGRDLHKTIEGIAQFVKDYPEVTISYDIIGDGIKNELEDYKALSEKLDVTDIIKFHGRLPYCKLKPFFDNCNIGVSFVPMTEYFEYQPPTKTFEYILSGLYTIATATYSNRKLISMENGLLIQDTSSDFAEAISKIWMSRTKLDEAVIRASLCKYTWKNIVNNRLKYILNKL